MRVRRSSAWPSRTNTSTAVSYTHLDTITEILKYWEEMEFIGGFEFLTQNREIQKILILFPGENAEDFKDPT